jgi:hypothetical protein
MQRVGCWVLGLFAGFWVSLLLGSTLGAVVIGLLVAWGVAHWTYRWVHTPSE